ncbi:MAG TPA: UDP binding domain-containing protein [Methylomusa anaerophila]|uniref:UDP-glucose 6-dehydrogenase YwqF n=1 Tax=Methylomusa anaerophila TaxID=1930071 RepID=A0A348AM82_9FIRM|nr:UDP-glucose/GDP-mannose dehydrogenase family protein [Methylomusa anaerophila]BBB92180.1 UDP-glucose 6-dehydrogenase YwqF [Methylomusa anaerophila]HML87806.1 UDP binding domain-containing protein [Methylomusa anaerophila]
MKICVIGTGYVGDNMLEAARGVDALLLVTEWCQFCQVDFDQIKHLMHRPIVFDGRNQYDPQRMLRLGFEYYCSGRGLSVC